MIVAPPGIVVVVGGGTGVEAGLTSRSMIGTGVWSLPSSLVRAYPTPTAPIAVAMVIAIPPAAFMPVTVCLVDALVMNRG